MTLSNGSCYTTMQKNSTGIITVQNDLLCSVNGSNISKKNASKHGLFEGCCSVRVVKSCCRLQHENLRKLNNQTNHFQMALSSNNFKYIVTQISIQNLYLFNITSDLNLTSIQIVSKHTKWKFIFLCKYTYLCKRIFPSLVNYPIRSSYCGTNFLIKFFGFFRE